MFHTFPAPHAPLQGPLPVVVTARNLQMMNGGECLLIEDLFAHLSKGGKICGAFIFLEGRNESGGLGRESERTSLVCVSWSCMFLCPLPLVFHIPPFLQKMHMLNTYNSHVHAHICACCSVFTFEVILS